MNAVITADATDVVTEPLNLLVITGSNRKGRAGGPMVSQWLVDHAKNDSRFNLDWADLAEIELPYDFDAEGNEAVAFLSERVAAADAFIVISPEFNHSYPAALKNAIDLTGNHWAGKPVGLVTYGGAAGGQRAAEHLRQILPELGALSIRHTLSFVNYWSLFSDEGQPTEIESCNKALDGFLQQLNWWAAPLKAAREANPYQ